MKPRPGFTLLEVLASAALASVVLLACLSMFGTSLTTRAHLEGELSRTRLLLVLEKHLEKDLREANLGLAQVLYQPESSPDFRYRNLALALPVAREVGTDRFVTSPADGRPVWQRLRVYFVPQKGDRLMRMDFLARNPEWLNPDPSPDPKPVIGRAELDLLCDHPSGMGRLWTPLGPPRLLSDRVDWFGVEVQALDATRPDGVREKRFLADVGLRAFYSERGSRVHKTCTLVRRIFSENSMFQVPAPPAPLPDLQLPPLPAPDFSGRPGSGGSPC